MLTLIYQMLSRLMECIASTRALSKKVDEVLAKQGQIIDHLNALQSRLDGMHEEVIDICNKILGAVSPPVPSALWFIAVFEGQVKTYKGEEPMLLQAGQIVSLTLKPVDKYGNAAVVDPTNPPKWTSSNPEVLGVTVEGDGMTGVAKSTGKVGTAQVSCVADAKLGPDVKEIIGVLDVEVKPGDAVMVTIQPGVPTDQ